ncbi:MAG TPA: hypothetical protein VGF99_11155 [Myxococcota bacterium]
MTTPSARRAPDLDSECPELVDDATAADLERALHQRHDPKLPPGELFVVQARVGRGAAGLIVVISEGRRHREVFVFARGSEGATPIEGPLGAAVDVMDDVLARTIGVERPALPLDWQGRPFGASTVFVRGELRDYAAEEAAAVLLDETPPPRAIPPRAND